MKVEQFFFPVSVAAAIVGIWAVLRKPNTGPTVSNQVSPASAGLPNYTPQAVTYQVNPPQLVAPTQAQLLSDPWNPNPALPKNPQYQTPPAYLAFNFGPGHDLSKIPLTDEQIQQLNGNRPTQNHGNCGCHSGAGIGESYLYGSGGCASDPNHSIYPDGRGGVMAQNGKTLVQKMNRQDPNWGSRAAYNLAGSDIDPNALPFRSNAVVQIQPIQPGQAQPAAPNQTFAPGAPGANVINQPGDFSAVNPNIKPLHGTLGALNQYGNQVLRLPASTISRLTGTLWTN